MMYSLSLNIINNQNKVINSVPYLYVSDYYNRITLELRELLRDIILEHNEKGYSLQGWKANVIVWSKFPANVHIFKINCDNIKEIQQLVIEKNARIKYQNIMENFKK